MHNLGNDGDAFVYVSGSRQELAELGSPSSASQFLSRLSLGTGGPHRGLHSRPVRPLQMRDTSSDMTDRSAKSISQISSQPMKGMLTVAPDIPT